MAVLSFDNPPAFATGAPLSYADLEVMRVNALTLDGMSLRGRRAWTDQAFELAPFGINPSPLSRASFQFRSGLTTMTLSVYSVIPGGQTHTVKVYFDNSLVSSTVLVGGNQTISITLTGLGLTDKRIVDIVVNVTRTPVVEGSLGYYALIDCYVSPVASCMTTSWPGVPTFGSLSAANLAQLATAQTWLFDRLNLVNMPTSQSIIYKPMFFWSGAPQEPIWQGSAVRSNGATRLRATVAYENKNVPSESLTLAVSGGPSASLTITSGQIGIYTFDLDVSGMTADSPFQVKLYHNVTTGNDAVHGALGTRISMVSVETTASSWTYATTPTQNQPRESLTFSALQTRLNAIGTICTAVYNRIQGAPDLFNRMRPFRWSPAIDDDQRAFYNQVYVASGYRSTDGLWVRGKGIKIGYGPIAVKHGKDEGDLYTWETQYTQDLVGGETVQDKYIGFDTFPGLFPGMKYFIIGDDVRYIAEVWR